MHREALGGLDHHENLTAKTIYLEGQLADACGDIDSIRDLLFAIDANCEAMIDRLEYEEFSPFKE